MSLAAPRVVAAVSDDLQPRIRALLPGCVLRFVQTGSELVRALDEARCAMMIVEVHFNGSSAVAALRFVLAREETFPVVCVRDVPRDRRGDTVLGALRSALRGTVTRDFIDLAEHPDDETGNARVRAMLMGLLSQQAAQEELSVL